MNGGRLCGAGRGVVVSGRLDAALIGKMAAALLVFLGGFTVMALEVIGARYLARDFGASFYVWISQIGVILTALAIGYAAGGALADRYQRAGLLAIPTGLAALFIFFIPQTTPGLLEAIVMRHPANADIPPIWVKLDPVMGSGLVFFLPCLALAIVSPYMVRVAARRLERVGTISGLIYAASTAGSIAGVFVSGYVFLDYLTVPTIFRAMGLVTLAVAGLSVAVDRWLK